jgi:hypothetical protein
MTPMTPYYDDGTCSATARTGSARAVTPVHCVNGHRYTTANTHHRPDGRGRACRTCWERPRTDGAFDIWAARRNAYIDSVALRLLLRCHGYLPATTATVGGGW